MSFSCQNCEVFSNKIMNTGQKKKIDAKKRRISGDGWEEWGGYMEAKKSKLQEQFKETVAKEIEKVSDIFTNTAIFVNGLTNPSAEELKTLMAVHGGVFQVYQNSTTTHIIASNLPNVKINKLGSVPIVKPSWITDSISLNKLLDYRRYLLYTNQSTSQPKLAFPVVPKADSLLKIKTASDPRFLEDFYNNSRLHLIATLGTEYKQLVSDWRDQKGHSFSGHNELLQLKSDLENVPLTTVIMHIDMDCFFVSVGLRKFPELRGLPVAVTHAKNAQIQTSKERDVMVTANLDRLPDWVETQLIDGSSSMSEVASCSYEARQCGVKNGMFLGAAAKLCPDLKTIPYDFEGYKEVSLALYQTIASYTLDIEAVSCDEMYVDVTSLLQKFHLSVAQFSAHIRAEIQSKTGCPCSTGFGSNRLQARLATKKAKPAGTYYLKAEDVETYMSEIRLSGLPGVGHVTLQKLKILGLETCGDVQVASLGVLQKELGMKVGETILEQAKGVDRKGLNFNYERKSVSAEINYGIRFKVLEECWSFLESLGGEVWGRLSEVKMRAKCVTLKLMVRASDAPIETAKYLGHGICDSFSKSTTIGHPIPELKSLHREVKALYEKMNVDFRELRGMGIQLSKLEKIAPINPTLSKFLQQESNSQKSAPKPSTSKVPKPKPKNSLTDFFKSKKETIKPNKLQKEEISIDVLNELPEDIRMEVMKEYELPITTIITKEPKSSQCKPLPNHRSKKNPFSGLQWVQLKPILYKWMQSGPKPEEYDIKLLGEHFRQLAMDQNVDWLRIAMNFLHRNFEPMGCLWHQAYNQLVDFLQQGMVASFGGLLFIKPVFECCS